MKRAMFLAAFLFILPQSATAQVVISEIMYDLETGSDSGREWVEVFNSGSSSATLTEWKFFENGSNHTIAVHTGGETLISGAYAVIADNPTKFLEDNAGFSGILLDSAFSLSNTGETLVLRCCASDLVDKDSVTYNSETGAVGDGKSLQRTSVSATTFTPNTPTPGTGSLVAESTTEDEDTETTTEEENTTQETATSTPPAVYPSSYVAPPMPVLFTDGGDDRTVIVGADTQFNGRAYNRQQDFVDNVRFSWNFGDGTVSEGQSVLHRYEYPGKYLVILSVALDRAAVSDRMVVTAEPAKLSFKVLDDSSLAIENHAGKDINLSRWLVSSFGKKFAFPEDTIILADATVRVSQTVHGLTLGPNTELLYPNGLPALKAGESTSAAATAAAASAPIMSAPVVPKASVSAKKKPSATPIAQEVPKPEEPIVALSVAEALGRSPSGETQTASAGSLSLGSWYWWLAAFGLSLVAVSGAVVAQRYKKSEWGIIEET